MPEKKTERNQKVMIMVMMLMMRKDNEKGSKPSKDREKSCKDLERLGRTWKARIEDGGGIVYGRRSKEQDMITAWCDGWRDRMAHGCRPMLTSAAFPVFRCPSLPLA